MSITCIKMSCGLRLSCYVWQLDPSMELRKLMSTASLSSCRRSCSEQLRTSSLSTVHAVRTIVRTLSLMMMMMMMKIYSAPLTWGHQRMKRRYVECESRRARSGERFLIGPTYREGQRVPSTPASGFGERCKFPSGIQSGAPENF